MSHNNRAGTIHHSIAALRCPYCASPLHIAQSRSLMCQYRHTFDIAKQGYVNLLTHAAPQQYSKELFESRHHIIAESRLYTKLHEHIFTVIQEYMALPDSPALILDAGCGEGSHLHSLMDMFKNESIQAVGIDISKEAVRMAAKNDKNKLWVVGDLARSPFADQSFHIILNILSPSNYSEFRRILASNGLVIKVVPRPGYLKELRDKLLSNTDRADYSNEKVVSRFKEEFQLLDFVSLQYTQTLSQAERIHLVNMSPLAWNADQERRDAFVSLEFVITVDLAILIGRKPS